jgi:hypothetical protein
MKKSRSLRLFHRLHMAWGIKWYRVPTSIFKLVYLDFYRDLLRAENLRDTATIESAAALPNPPRPNWRYLHGRSPDGSYNDLTSPSMGRAETRFGRNVPLSSGTADVQPGATGPSPHAVSECLLARRGEFKPAEPINLLATAWLQFMVHDWMDHGLEKDSPDKLEVRVDDGPCGHVHRTRRDYTRDRAPVPPCPTFLNRATHWWDASQIYGSDAETLGRLRSGKDGKMRVQDGLLPAAPDSGGQHADDDNGGRPTEDTGVRANWWLGLGLMHTLFVLEHNAICDALHDAFPHWDDDELFDHARLVNAALMAKIHTVEWTPALLDHPAIIKGMYANWWGLATEYLHRLSGRPRDNIWLALRELVPGIARSEAFGGVRGSPTDHHGAPYAITEDFVAIYRMHPLIPDVLRLYSLAAGRPREQAGIETEFMHYLFRHTRDIQRETGLDMADLFYSFGVANPGALVLRNFPEGLRSLDLDHGRNGEDRIDLAMVDIIRDRERGVPRYNDFRSMLHMPRLRSFEELIPDDRQSGLRGEVERLYGHVDNVDLMVGLLAEPRPEGFAFSNTAFVVFVVMASRRLKSDRFFSSDYRPEVYTQPGLDWIDQNTMNTVLLRHYPALAPYLDQVSNPFQPWQRRGAVNRRRDKVEGAAPAPAVRVRIPLLADIVLVKDPGLAARLNDHQSVDRVPARAGPLLNRVLQRRITRELRVNGSLLPAFAGRGDEARRQRQAAMAHWLSARDLEAVGGEIEQLARFVRGESSLDEEERGMTAQRLTARLLDSDYRATREGYRDACTVSEWHRLFSRSGKRRRARQRLWAAAGEDGYVIHGITFAVHNLVDILLEMRRLAALCRDSDPPAAEEVVERCLVAPNRVLRICHADIEMDELDRPLKRGTLLILLLRRMHGGTMLSDRAFSRDAWSRCPAHELIPKVLAEVWDRALARPDKAPPC